MKKISFSGSVEFEPEDPEARFVDEIDDALAEHEKLKKKVKANLKEVVTLTEAPVYDEPELPSHRLGNQVNHTAARGEPIISNLLNAVEPES